MINIALSYEDGRIGVMQWIGPDDDAEIERGIKKMVDRPREWQRITEAEAAAIRAARPKPEPVSASVTPVPAVNTEELEAVKAENAALEARLAYLEARMGAFFEGVEEAVRKT